MPVVGSFIHTGAKATNGVKDVGLILVEGGGLLWLALLKLTRLTGSTPEEHLRNSPLGEIMCSLSPWLRTALLSYAALSSAGVLGYASNLIVKAVQKKPELAKNLSQIIIEFKRWLFSPNMF